MKTTIRTAIVGVFAVLMCFGLASPASADIAVSNGKAADLPIRPAKPSTGDVERSFAGFFNPNVSTSAKYAVTYKGDTPKVQKAVSSLIAMGRSYNYLSMQGRVTNISINGNQMVAKGNGVMAGFPASSFTYYYLRDGGIWKYDFKTTCAKMGGCTGNPDFGY